MGGSVTSGSTGIAISFSVPKDVCSIRGALFYNNNKESMTVINKQSN
mgnify:FL=1